MTGVLLADCVPSQPLIFEEAICPVGVVPLHGAEAHCPTALEALSSVNQLMSLELDSSLVEPFHETLTLNDTLIATLCRTPGGQPCQGMPRFLTYRNHDDKWRLSEAVKFLVVT